MAYNTKTFEEELSTLLNRESLENQANTPDFILARYMRECYEAFVKATNRRAEWLGEEPGSGASQGEM